jgi:predicted SnoaL-like aldol condensation-catalyzing enzyme
MTNQLEENKKVAMDYIDRVFNKKDFKAIDECWVSNYVVTDTFFARSPDDFKTHVVDHLTRNPNTTVEFKRVMAEGDLVFLLLRERSEPGDPGHLTSTITRVDNGRIAEHWAFAGPMPED